MSDNKTALALISEKDLSLVEDNSLNGNQLKHILKRTPQQYVKQRPAKGGGTWSYVSGGYVKKCLNLIFGWDWSFEIVDEKILHGEVIVKGRLTCRSNGKEISKMQFGNKDIIYKTEKVFNEDLTPKMIEKYGKTVQETKPSDIPLSIGNDLKSAATDCLKKCASEIGIASDIYNKDEFREVDVILDSDSEELYLELNKEFEAKKDLIPSKDFKDIERIINKKEVSNYQKVIDFLKTLKNE